MPWVDGKWHVPTKGKGSGKSPNKAAATLLVETLTTLISPGKGKAKGKGKAAAPGKPLKQGEKLAEGQWLRKNHICEWAIKRMPNPPGTKRCGNTKCCLPKSEAMNPPHDQRVAPAAPSYSIKTALANATAAAAKERSAALAKEKAEAAKEAATTTTCCVAEATAT